MQTLYMLKGLPGAGKTTFAREMVSAGAKRINRDDLRDMLDNGVFSRSNESLVKQIQSYAVVQALRDGQDVVLDNCNLRPEDEETWRIVARIWEVNFEIIDMKTPIEECILRDSIRENPVGETAIRSMSRLEPNPLLEADYEYDK